MVSLAKVQEAYEKYQDAVHEKKRNKKRERERLLNALNDRYEDGLSRKQVPDEVFESDEVVSEFREFLTKKDTNYKDLPEYKGYISLRNEEICKRYVYKASNGIKVDAIIKEISKELGIKISTVETEINKFDKNRIPKFHYVLVKNKTHSKCYCSDLEAIKQFCLNNQISYEDITNYCGDYELSPILSTAFSDISRGRAFIYEGYMYTKKSNNFFACLQ